MTHYYPLSMQNDRPLPKGYRGRVYIWDVDKTYLSTRFSSVKGLARIPVEFAIDKKAIPGMPEVLRGLRRGPKPEVECLPLYFISAGPPFLRSVIENKMLMDGVEQDGITFKDWIQTFLELRPGRLWEQLGFKLTALLLGHRHRIHAHEYLFGDDTEQDPLAFSLYAKVINHGLSAAQLDRILEDGGVAEDDRQGIRKLVEGLPVQRGHVEKIFIHLEHNTSPAELKKFGNLILPVKGGFQLALALFDLGLVDVKTVHAAHRALHQLKKYHLGSVGSLLKDAQKRKIIRPENLKKLKLEN